MIYGIAFIQTFCLRPLLQAVVLLFSHYITVTNEDTDKNVTGFKKNGVTSEITQKINNS